MGRMAYWQERLGQLASSPLGDAHPGGTWPYARGEQLRGAAATTPRAAGPFSFSSRSVRPIRRSAFCRRSLSRRCCCRGRLCRVRDLADDLDDVAVRVERAPLAIGAVASGKDVANAIELPLRAQLAGVRLDVTQRPADQLSD